MKYSIVYSTHTNNAVKLSEVIAKQIDEKDIVFNGRLGADLSFIEESDIIFVGFWTTANSCDPRIQNLLSTTKNKKIAIFGSCGFGTEEDGHFEVVKSNVLKHLDPSNKLLGFYICLGAIGEKFVEAALKSNGKEGEDFHFPMYRKYYQNDMGHPNKEELETLATWTKTILDNNK